MNTKPIREFLAATTSDVVEIVVVDLMKLLDAADQPATPRVPVLDERLAA